MKYGFIGAGNMAQAIIRGMTSSKGGFLGTDIYAYNPTGTASRMLEAQCGIHACGSIQEVAEAADIVVLAVKPNKLETVAKELRPVCADKLYLSIAAGKQLAYLETLLGILCQ